MKRLHITSPTKYLAKALKSSGLLAGFEITSEEKPKEAELIIYDNGASLSLGKLEFVKPVVLNDIINAIKNYEIHQTYRLGNITFDPKTRKLISSKSEENLTETENALLLKICLTKEGVSINQLSQSVLGYDERAETKTVETHIYRLRQKIKALTNDEVLNTTSTGYLALNYTISSF